MVEKHKILYLILGIGIGIILSNTLYSIYPKVEYVQMSDDTIIERSRELGMVSLKENIKIENESDNNLNQEDEKLKVEEPTKEAGPELVKEPEIVKESVPVIENTMEPEIRIESGWGLTKVTSELYDKRVINDKEEFMNFVKSKKLSKIIKVGTYKIKINTPYDEILKQITKNPN